MGTAVVTRGSSFTDTHIARRMSIISTISLAGYDMIACTFNDRRQSARRAVQCMLYHAVPCRGMLCCVSTVSDSYADTQTRRQ